MGAASPQKIEPKNNEDPQENEDPKKNEDQKNEDSKQSADRQKNEEFKQNADLVVKPPSSKPAQLAADCNFTRKTQKATSSSSPEAIPSKVGESDQQVKQPQPEANAKSGSDESAKTDPKAGVMNADPPQGPTGSKEKGPGAVGGNPVNSGRTKARSQGRKAANQPGSKNNAPTEEAPTKQVAQLHQLLEPSLPESCPQGQPKPDPDSKYPAELLTMKPPKKGTQSSKVNLLPGSVLRPYRTLTRILLPSMLPTILNRQREVVAQGVEQTILKR